MKNLKREKGLSIIEFTLVATALLLIMMALIEVGRYIYSLQLINEMTRVSARLGVVCRVQDQNDIPALVVPTNAPNGFTAANLSVDYLDSNGSPVDLAGAGTFTDIHFVRARVIDFDYQFAGLMSVFDDLGLIAVPEFESIRPRESLGILPSPDGTQQENDC
ncbi:TadE/TadG family type IV pilus assembly protein [Vibrio agarivorans]|uniref:TadE/TadG family type IV pilus assembly protein n=1 Tax=Vibrio agarivorans TaxID=153622 RepID=UPI0022315E00|nr:TadE family protein [Vibrio agarivorans]MDN3662608.1 pilus assembly protein [Vibrio agarivorans]